MPAPIAAPRATAALRGRLVRDENLRAFERRLALVFGRCAARGRVLPKAHREPDRDRLDRRVALLVGEPGERRRADLARLARGDARRAAEPGDDARGLAEADQENALRSLGAAGEEERLVARAAEIFAVERALEGAAERGVDRGEGGSESGARGERENEERRVGRVRLRAACGDPEFHRRCSERSAQGGTRTRMARKPLHFECSASTNSATRASVVLPHVRRISRRSALQIPRCVAPRDAGGRAGEKLCPRPVRLARARGVRPRWGRVSA